MHLKHLLITVMTVTSLSASAQIKKGSVFLGGNFFYANQTHHGSDARYTSVGLSPAIGKAIRDNVIAGIDIIYHNQQTTNFDTSKSTDQSIGAGLFIRKYMALGKGFYLFGQARAGGSYISVRNKMNDRPDGKGYSVNLSAYPGISFEVNRKLHLEAGLANLFHLNYSQTSFTPYNENKYKNSAFSVGTSLSNGTSLTVGIRIFLAS